MTHPTPSLTHTIWLREHNAAFVYLPKVACTSWKLYLWQALGNALPDDVHYRQVHDHTALALPYVGTLPFASQQEFQIELSIGRISTYAVIREPKARILSAYLDKILHHTNPNSHFSQAVIPDIQRFAGLKDNNRPSFHNFLNWINAHDNPTSLNDHWRPMSTLLGCDSAENYSRLWDMDHLNQAVSFFAELLGTSIPFPSRQQLGKRGTYESQNQIEAYFGAAETEIFHHIYAHDLRLYNQVQHL